MGSAQTSTTSVALQLARDYQIEAEGYRRLTRQTLAELRLCREVEADLREQLHESPAPAASSVWGPWIVAGAFVLGAAAGLAAATLAR